MRKWFSLSSVRKWFHHNNEKMVSWLIMRKWFHYNNEKMVSWYNNEKMVSL
jgi:hypothetical protein